MSRPYELPTTAEIGGREYAIRSDYRAVLDVMSVMADAGIGDGERAYVALSIFYEEADAMPSAHAQEALDYLYWFVNGGKEPSAARKPKLMDWEQDFELIVAPVNRVLGAEVRELGYLHWWSFLSAYMEIGDCLFAQVVAIRKKKRAGQRLDKSDQRFYRENRELVDFKVERTESEQEMLDSWIM